MAHYFDIKPPEKKSGQKKHSDQSRSTKKTKSSVGLVFIVMVLGFILFFSFINSNKTKTIDQQNVNSSTENIATKTSTSPTDQIVKQTQSNPEASILTSPTPTIAKFNIQITVLNGSGEVGVANSAKEELEKNGIEVYKIGNTQNNYTQTIIYYTNVNKSLADKIQETLADYNPKLIEDNALADNENILVVIGE